MLAEKSGKKTNLQKNKILKKHFHKNKYAKKASNLDSLTNIFMVLFIRMFFFHNLI